MRIDRCLAMGTAALGMLSAAWAQFTGPAPLSWRWAHSTPVAPLGSPLVVNDVVYTAVGNRMFALDRATGNQRWRYPLEGISGYFRTAPLYAEGNVIAAADNKYLYAVDAATGESKWQWLSQVPIVGQPVLAGTTVVVELNDNSLMGIRADNGQPAWTAPAPSEDPLPYRVYDGVSGGLAVHGTSVIFMTDAGELVSVSSSTRKQLWKAKFSSVSADATPVVFGDVVFVNSGTWLVAVNAISGIGRWQQNTGEPLAFSPAVSAEGVFTVTMDGKAMLFDTGTGRPKWKQAVDLGSVLSVRPSAIDKHFLAPLTSGALTVVNPANGEIVWSYLIRPLYRSQSGEGGGAQPGGGRGGALGGGIGIPGGGGAAGGGAAAGGGRGGALGGGAGGPGAPGGGGTQTTTTQVIAVPASGPAVLAGQTLLVLASDGSMLAFDKETGVDKTGPTIKMTWPNAGEQVNGGDLELNFKIDDEATGVDSKSVTVIVNGQPMEVEYRRDGYAIVKINSYGKNKPLGDGRKTIKVSANDWFGNASSSEYGLTIDNSLAPLRPATTGANRPGGGGIGGPGGRGGGGGGRGDGE